MLSIVATLCVWTAGLGPADLDVRGPLLAAPSPAAHATIPELYPPRLTPPGRHGPRVLAALAEELVSDDTDDHAAESSPAWVDAGAGWFAHSPSPPRHSPSPRRDRSPILRC